MNCTPLVRQYDILKKWKWYDKLDTKKREKGDSL